MDTVDFEHTIDASLGSVDLEALLGYRLMGQLRLYARMTGSVLVRRNVYYREHIINSPGISYDTVSSRGDRYERNVYSGIIPTASVFPVSLSLGTGYSFRLDRNEHLLLEPQIFYTLGLNSIIHQDSGAWYVNSLRLGFTIRYAPLGIPPPPGPSPVIDDPPPLRPG
ncbi:MAG: hypothetical protein JWQ98_2217 [Chlorobi bacterium]|nr:hypothetical protein [Chlorobiota bacterium]